MAFVNERAVRRQTVLALPPGGVHAVDFRYTADGVAVNDTICMGRLPQGAAFFRAKLHNDSLGPAGTQVDLREGYEDANGNLQLGSTMISNHDVENAGSATWVPLTRPFQHDTESTAQREPWFYLEVEGNPVSGNIALVVEFFYHDIGF